MILRWKIIIYWIYFSFNEHFSVNTFSVLGVVIKKFVFLSFFLMVIKGQYDNLRRLKLNDQKKNVLRKLIQTFLTVFVLIITSNNCIEWK